MDARLAAMKQENQALWREVASLRQKHMKQQQIVNKLIQFLISVVQPNNRTGLGLKRRYPLMLGEASPSPSSSSSEGKKSGKNAGRNEGAKVKAESVLKGMTFHLPLFKIMSNFYIFLISLHLR